jgi:platelet-activating factor acetylhydrolase
MAIFPSIFPYLPRYPGPFQVGSIDVEVPLSESKTFDTTETSVETILIRLFYPADANGLTKCAAPSWLPLPSMEYAKGYAAFLKQPVLPTSVAISLAVYNTTIPAMENAPPVSPPAAGLPVMIFSHGLGGSRNTYSQWCGSIASYGVVVAAIEHRDGSAPVSVVHAESKSQYTVPYRRIAEYNDQTKVYRTSQLAQRTYEVSRLVTLLRDINGGKVVDVNHDKRTALERFKGSLNIKKGELIMSGHSFGAATTVAVCKDKEIAEAGYPLKDEFKAAIMLDIWMLVYIFCDLANHSL